MGKLLLAAVQIVQIIDGAASSESTIIEVNRLRKFEAENRRLRCVLAELPRQAGSRGMGPL